MIAPRRPVLCSVPLCEFVQKVDTKVVSQGFEVCFGAHIPRHWQTLVPKPATSGSRFETRAAKLWAPYHQT